MANQYDTNLKLQAIADAIGNSQSSGLISALEDIADAVAGGGGGGSSTAGLVSDNFSETDTYDLGDYCIHNNTLYVCINAITTPGPWDLSDWQATNAGLELTSLNSAIATQTLNASFAPAFASVSNKAICSYKKAGFVWCGGYLSGGVQISNGMTIFVDLPAPLNNATRIPIRLASSTDSYKTGAIYYNGTNWVYSGDTSTAINFNMVYLAAE